MSPDEAKHVIETLAKGIHPETGEVLPNDNPIHSPMVIRALFLAAGALSQSLGKVEGAKSAKPEHTGKSWNSAEEAQLLADFDSGLCVASLAERHHRTTGGIKARLARNGRLISESS